METRLAEWRQLLRSSTTQARSVLQRVLRGRITFTPTEDGYQFSCPTRFDKLFSGVFLPKPGFVEEGDQRGVEHITPEDTFDLDYGTLLERHQPTEGKKRPKRVKRLASPAALGGAVPAGGLLLRGPLPRVA